MLGGPEKGPKRRLTRRSQKPHNLRGIDRLKIGPENRQSLPLFAQSEQQLLVSLESATNHALTVPTTASTFPPSLRGARTPRIAMACYASRERRTGMWECGNDSRRANVVGCRRRWLRRQWLLLLGWLLVGCSRPSVVPPTASIPKLLPPVPVGPFDSSVPAAPSVESQPLPDEELWKPQAALREWQTIVLHHTATTVGNVETIHETHLKKKDSRGNAWLGIGYHFVIGNGQGMADGAVEPTFRWRQQLHGAHAGDGTYNQTGIGIVLVGNFEKTEPTEAQWQAVRRLVRHLSQTYAISSEQIVGHGDIKATACPGRYFPLARLKADVAALDDSGGFPLARFVPETGAPRKEALRK
ncbi:MAG: hypothetical protein B7Z55_05690 [Planctomycetales bacterium 12-60-4]|nr:MAG: hypothetical protein B7Z55_05690 [Planctomycetales bacterium 12-60-4]